jgi:hypothetical protein
LELRLGPVEDVMLALVRRSERSTAPGDLRVSMDMVERED